MQMQLASRDPKEASSTGAAVGNAYSAASSARDVDFDALLMHFQAVQDKHLVAKKEQKKGQLERLMQQQ